MQYKKPELFEKIMRFIYAYEESHQGGPSQREIASAVGITNSSACTYLNDLVRQGRIFFDSRRHPVSAERYAALQDMTVTPYGAGAPLLGSIACGGPKDAEEQFEEIVSLPKSIFGDGPLFLLRADGESMIEAGIDDGDLVVIRQQQTARTGQIVAALVDGQTTLKGFFPEPDRRRIRLQPANASMNPIYVRDLEIQGVAVFVIKELGTLRL